MRKQIIVFSILMLFAARLHGADEGAGRIAILEQQVKALTDAVELQRKTMDEQQQKLDDQAKMLANVANSGAPIASADLNARIARAEIQSAQAIKIAGRKKQNDLNMAIGAAVDTSFGYEDGPKGRTDRSSGADFTVRGAELVFYADVDPFFKSYIVLNSTPDAKNNDEATPSLEEAAITSTSLSYAQVKGGRFFMPFGRLSQIHDHDLPFTTRPPSLDTYVGGESAGDGVQVSALIPIDHFLQVTGGAFNKLGASFPLLNGSGTRRDFSELTYFGKVLTSFDICDSHTIEAGVSTAQVPDRSIRRDLDNFELTYHYHPQGGTVLRDRLVWGTELMRNQLRTEFTTAETPDAPLVHHNAEKRGYGGYSYAELFLSRHWSLGPRADLFENVDPTVRSLRTFEQTYTAFVSYNFSEFSRLRFEYDHTLYFDGRNANQFYLQWTAFWGAHTHSFEQR